MNPFLSVLPVCTLLSACLLAQGQTLTFGVSPGQTTTGTASGGGPGSIGIAIGGHGTIPVSVPPGTSSAGIASAMAAALTARGFAATLNGTEVTVTAGPGGAPLQQGGGIGSTDSGILGVRARVAPGAPPGLKRNGGAIPAAQQGRTTNQPGNVQVDAEVLKLVNGVWTLLWIQVVVPVFPGDDGAAVNVRARQALENAGLRVNSIHLPSNIQPITRAPAMGLDRTDDGGKVQSVGVRVQGGASELYPAREAGAGQMPPFGPADFDHGMFSDGFESGSFSAWQGDSRPGAGGELQSFVPPSTVGMFMIRLGSSLQPWQPTATPLPFIGPSFHLAIDPLQAVTSLALPDPLGVMRLPLPIPADPSLATLRVQMQALVIDPNAPNPLGTVQSTQGIALGVGPGGQ